MSKNRSLIIELAKSLSLKKNRKIEDEHIFEALFMIWGDKNEMKWVMEILNFPFKYEEAYNALIDFDFDVFDKEIHTDLELIKGMLYYETKAKIRSGGVVWIIHKYDVDPFPSNPHAHQIQNNIKLDLSNGNCFRSRLFLDTIPKKELLKIRAKAEVKLKGVPALPPLTV